MVTNHIISNYDSFVEMSYLSVDFSVEIFVVAVVQMQEQALFFL